MKASHLLSGRTVALCYLIAFWSGFFVMGIELLGGRLLSPNFGSSIYVWGALITIFMLSLSLGYLAGGRYSQRNPGLAKLGMLLAAAALTTLPVLSLSGDTLENLAIAIPDPRFGSLAAAALLFFVPTFFSGMVSPYCVRLLVDSEESSGRRAGQLYFVSTFGSAAGTIVTSFYLVLWLEHNTILISMIAISAALAVLAVVMQEKKDMKNLVGLMAAVFVFVAPAAVSQEKLIHSERSQYREVRVYETNGERCMCFTVSCRIGRQSCINLADPHSFALNYTRMMMAGTFLMGEVPKRVLIIGLGGGSIPTALRELLPKSQIDVVEIDPAVTRVARQYFGFKDGPSLKVLEMDGRVYVKRALRDGVKYDLVMLDAFDNEYIPEHMLTRDFLTEVKSLLSPNGVLVGNTFSSSKLYDHESTTYAAVFGKFFNLKAANRVIIARPAGLPSTEQLRAKALEYELPLRGFGVDLQEVLPMFSTTTDWDTTARVLTDQWMPANLLNH